MSTLRPALVLMAALLVICCVIYPALVTGVAQLAFPSQANGSLIVDRGTTRGSSLIGQTIAEPDKHPEYLVGRPSAASNDGATGITVSSGTNYGPSNAALIDAVRGRVEAVRATGVSTAIPADLVMASASGLDPDLSPEGAWLQIRRIAKARSMREDTVRAIIDAHTESALFGVVGEPRVNVLAVNLDLDRSTRR